MSERVLPLVSVEAVVGKSVHDELVDVTERQHLLLARLDRHRGKRDIRVRRLLVAVRRLTRPRHLSSVKLF